MNKKILFIIGIGIIVSALVFCSANSSSESADILTLSANPGDDNIVDGSDGW